MNKKSVLFLDDEMNVLNALKRIFSNSGYEIILHHKPEEALAFLKTREVNLIVSDYRMPGMTGADFLKESRNLSPHSVRFVLSGYADAQVVTEMIEKGEIFRFMIKPWDNDELKKALADGLAHQERMKGFMDV